MSMNVQIIKASGTSYDVGYRIGKTARKKILKTLMYYQHSIAMNRPDWTWNRARKFSAQFIPVIEAIDKDILDEMRGIADGSDLSFEDILAVNCHYEIGRWADECTTIYFGKKATRSSHAYLLENWDYALPQIESLVLLDLSINGKPRVVMLSEAGIVGRMGMNEKYIGIVGNTLKNDEVSFDKLPVPVFYRAILNSTTTRRVEEIIRTGAASSYNFMIYSQGMAENLEMSVKETFIHSDEAKMCHTNHFIYSSAASDHLYDTAESMKRYRRACQLLDEKEQFDDETMITILRDHENYPDSICRHVDESTPFYKQSATLASIIIDMTSLSMKYIAGYPCADSFTTVYEF